MTKSTLSDSLCLASSYAFPSSHLGVCIQQHHQRSLLQPCDPDGLIRGPPASHEVVHIDVLVAGLKHHGLIDHLRGGVWGRGREWEVRQGYRLLAIGPPFI